MNLNKMTKPISMAFAALAITSAGPAMAGDSLNGTSVLISNTFTGGLTKGVETDVGMFGMNNNLFASVGDGVEQPSFLGLYDIDVSDHAISYQWVDTGFSQSVAGPTPDGNHDRNYFVFNLPQGKAITAVEFDAAGSTLLDGSADPTAMVLTRNKIVTDFAGGVVRGMGFAPRFTVTVGDAE